MGHDASDSGMDHLVASNEHGRYCVPRTSMHRAAAQKILAGEVWERETLDFLRDSCVSGDVVHAGTYFGDFLPALASAMTDAQVLWAFEPNPVSHRCAEMTLELNSITNVDLTNAALGMQSGRVPMLIKGRMGRDLGGASRIVPEARTAPDGHSVMVHVVRLDDLMPEERSVSLVQLDVEGFEQDALAGAMKTIRRCRPVLVLESLPERSWLERHLMPLGYEVRSSIEGNTILRCE